MSINSTLKIGAQTYSVPQNWKWTDGSSFSWTSPWLIYLFYKKIIKTLIFIIILFFFIQKRWSTGQPDNWGGTGNSLIRLYEE